MPTTTKKRPTKAVPHLTVAERAARGKAARAEVPRSSHELCGWTLARAHARSGDRIAIATYLGKGPTFDRAIVEFSCAYAEQNDSDYEALVAAVESGRITAEKGL